MPCRFAPLDGQPIDLQLAGHAHGGQIAPFDFLVKSRYPLFRGRYTSGQRAIYVSSGAGPGGRRCA